MAAVKESAHNGTRDVNGRFQPGNPGGPGRRKGTPNKATVELRDMILGALDDAGGQDYLARQAEENPGPFLALVAKILPKDVAVSGDMRIQVVTGIPEQLGEPGASRN